jgi:hypothetical protein
MLAFAFQTLRLQRVWAQCLAENRASVRVLERLKMRQERCQRRPTWMQNRHESPAMPRPNLTPFAGQKYLNLESFKRDGTPVQTPVWFAEDQGVLYVYTLANAGTVKRIRRNPHIRLAPVPCVAQ